MTVDVHRRHQTHGLRAARPTLLMTMVAVPRIVSLKDSPYSITERWVPQLILVLGSQPAGDVIHKPGGRLPLLSARPAVTPATLKMSAANFATW